VAAWARVMAGTAIKAATAIANNVMFFFIVVVLFV
jgi:hypothetical protein